MLISRGFGYGTLLLTKGYGAIRKYIKKKADIQRGGGSPGTGNYIGGSFPILIKCDCVLDVYRDLDIKQNIKSLVSKSFETIHKIPTTFTKKFKVHKECPLAVFRNIIRNIHSTSLIVKDITKSVYLPVLLVRKIEYVSFANTFLKRNILEIKKIKGILTNTFYIEVKVISMIKNNLLRFLLLDDDYLIIAELVRRKQIK